MSEVRVKICGVADPANACMAAEMGADFIGLNFYPRSPRYVGVGRALEIAESVREASPGVKLVGVFVNPDPEEVEEIDRRLGLDLLQLSGDETPGLAAPWVARVIKAFRTGGDPGAGQLEAWPDVWAWLIDAPNPPNTVLYGGTGTSWSYGATAGLAVGDRRVFLAGGLGPDNVRQAIQAGRPFGVDVCSRVESAPGIKDPALLRRLFEEVRNAQS